MRYDYFIEKAHNLPYFTLSFLVDLGDSERNAENQLIRWTAQGKVWRLKRGLYTLPDRLREAKLSLRWLANRLYSPSYVSLDYVLSFYDLIPEQVTMITSVSTAKTTAFRNRFGQFTYNCIKPERFFGFMEVQDENGVLVRVASPEKALLDKIYFDPTWRAERSYFEENLRLQNVSQLKTSLLRRYAKRFAMERIYEAVRILDEWRRV